MAALDPIAPVVPVAPPVTFRRFDDVDGQRSDIYSGAVQALGSFKPLQNATHKLEIVDPEYDENEFAPGLAEEKDAILKQRSLHRALKATVRLSDNNGTVLDQQRMTVAHIPHVNSRGLFIRNGAPYVLRNQLRLRPGAYTRERKNGGLETHFNVKPGTGRGFRVEMEPEDGIFRMKIGQSGTRLYPLLRELGVEDKDMAAAWGDELFEKNFRAKSGKDDVDLVKIAQKFSKEGLQIKPEDARQIILDSLGRAELDEDTTEMTLGERIKGLRPDVLLKATKKQLDVAQGKIEADNRDSQAFQSVHSPDDLLKERLSRDMTGGLRQILWQASRDGNLKRAKPGFLNKNVTSLFEGSGLALGVEDVNPIETLDLRQAITRMGDGGISDESSVSREARNVQGSYLGVIDAARAPECYDDKTEVMTSVGWKPWPLVTAEDRLACLVDGALAFHCPESLYAAPYSGLMYGAKNTHIDYLVTPNHRMYTRCPRKLRSGSKCAWQVTTPQYVHGKNRLVLTSGFASYTPPVTSGDTFTLPEVRAADWDKPQPHGAPPRGRINPTAPPIDMGDWLEFLGWYISEGCIGGAYTVKISQCPKANPKNVAAISRLLRKLPFAWNFCQDSFTLSGKQLVSYLSQFGKSDTKFLPEYVFEASVEHRERLYTSLMLGDGKRYKGLDRRSYSTGSPQLAADFARLAFSLGRSSTTSVYKDSRQDSYLPACEIYVHTRNERVVTGKPGRRSFSDYYTVEDYDGMVYCATVPGNLLYVRRNGCIGFWCGNSSKMGLDLRVTDAALKGSDNQLYTTVRNVRTNAIEVKSARELSGKTVTFPGEWKSADKRIPVVRGGDVTHALKDEVDYEIIHPGDMMARATQLVPFAESVKGARLLMGARMSQQALPLDEGEAPYVQAAMPDGSSLHKAIGIQSGARVSPADGVVTKVGEDFVEVADADGKRHRVELYHNYPMSRKTVLHNDPVVSVGTPVTKGQTLAKSNFTDKEGVVAVGRNLRVAYMAAKGQTMEDAFVVSESAAKKLATQNMYKSELNTADMISTKKDDYTAIYADKFKPTQLDKLDDNGIIRVGMTVSPGDPLILGIGKKEIGPIGAIMDTPKSTTSDKAEIWDHHNPGIVTDVVRTRDGIRVFVKSKTALTLGSKISGLHGNKGVISAITPDDQMPRDEQGRPIEVIFNTFGIVSRHNPGALAAAVLGKVAEKTGKPYVLKPFGTSENVADFALREAEKHGISETETVTDPTDNRAIPKVFVGNAYVMALQHQAEGKLSARGQGSYTIDGFPARGGSEGCFVGKQSVVTQYGHMDIAHIVEKRLGVQALTWSGDLREWVYRPVTDWFTYRADVADILTVGFVGPVVSREAASRTSLFYASQKFSATRNHMVSMFDGSMKSVGELAVGDQLSTWGVNPTSDQRSFLLGCLLGDGSITSGTTSTPSVFACEHSAKQSYYVAWKHKLLASLTARVWDTYHPAGLISGKPRAPVHGKQLQLYHPHVTPQLRELFYSPTGEKVITSSIVDQLDDRALVVWFLDDGCMHNKSKKKGKPQPSASFATHGFSSNGVDLLKTYLEKRLGCCIWKCASRPGQWSLAVDRAGSWRLAALVAAYVPWDVIPKSKAWLVRFAQDAQKTTLPKSWAVSGKLERIPMPVGSIEPYTHDKPGVTNIPVYDITVADTHLYCANAALVSNSKRVALMDASALVSAGATNFLKESKLIRGQRNDEYWRQLKQGETPQTPGASLADEQFKAQLAGAGVLVHEDGGKEQLRPMLDKDVDAMAQHEVENSSTFDFNTLDPVKGGLFDIGTTGGAGGNRFSKISLGVKVPHPMFVDPIIRVLGITNNKLQAVMKGEDTLDGKTGQAALESALGNLDVDREIELTKHEIRTGKTSRRDAAVKKLQYLAGLKTLGVKPSELLVSKVAVVPPKYRPVVSGQNVDMIHDLNYLYHDLMEAKQNHSEASKEFGTAGDEYWTLFKAVQAVSGVDDPVTPKSVEQGVKGILKTAIGLGSSPKAGAYQRRVIGNSVDMVGRGVITADATLDMDTVGLPKAMAWEIFKPFIIRRLSQNGMPSSEAVKAVTDQSHVALRALQAELAERPIVYNRAPALHRYAYTGAWAKLVDDDALHMPYATLKSLGADFDGDGQTSTLTLGIDVLACGGKEEAMAFATTHSLPIISISDTLIEAVCDLRDFPRLEYTNSTIGPFGNKIDYYKAPEQLRVVAYDEASKAPVWAKVSHWSVHPSCPVEIVTLQSGRQIFTDDDPRAVYGVSRDSLSLQRFTPSTALAAGVAVPRSLQVPQPETFTGTLDLSAIVDAATAHSRPLRRLAPLTPALGYAIAALVGDGWAGRCDGLAKNLNICGQDLEVLDATLDGLKEIFDNGELPAVTKLDMRAEAGGGRYGNVTRYTLPSVSAARWFDELCGHGASQKQLPRWFMTAAPDVRSAMLCGLLDTDGTICVSRAAGKKPQLMCAFTTTSLRLAREVAMLCSTLGIRATVSKFSYRETGTAWQVTLSSVDVICADLPYLRNLRKLAKLEEGRKFVNGDSPSAVRHDLVPIPTQLAADLSAVLGCKDKAYTTLRKIAGGSQTCVSRWLANQIIERVGPQALGSVEASTWLAIVANTRITWDPVAGVEKTGAVEELYDLTVPGYETFMNCDGVILSNTENVHVPVTAESVEDVKNKLMPSKNLFFTGDFETHYEPQQDYVAGLHLAGKMDPSQPVRTFATAGDAKTAYLKGEISARTPVRILHKS